MRNSGKPEFRGNPSNFAKKFYEQDGPPETGFTRFRAFLVRKSDKSDLRWSSPRVTEAVVPQSVQERVCFMCSSVLGTMTQSWWPPLLGQMPTSSSVSVSMKAMPLDSRWKPLNTPTTYLPS